jgi:hypothetical protein
MKSLDQIEPRTPISSAPFVITNPGSYYLVANLNVPTGNAIVIATNGVTLDLNGFTLSSNEPTNTGTAILCNAVSDVAILNGHILGGVTFSGTTYSGPGFGRGIWFPSAQPSNVRIAGVTVTGCLLDGINVGSGISTLVQGSTVNTVGGTGIGADSVSDSTAYQCGTGGIMGTTAHNCYATTTSGGALAFFCRNVNNCFGLCSGPNSYGIYSLGVVNNSYGQTVSGYGIYAGTATGCRGISSSSSSGTGVYASTVENCYGVGANQGILAFIAINSYGTSSNGIAIGATTALNCYGLASGDGDGIDAQTSAIGSFGQSSRSGTGLGAYACQNCTGSSLSGIGISATTAIGCYAVGYGSTSIGLHAYIANSCVGDAPGGGTPQLVTYKYNMP